MTGVRWQHRTFTAWSSGTGWKMRAQFSFLVGVDVTAVLLIVSILSVLLAVIGLQPPMVSLVPSTCISTMTASPRIVPLATTGILSD